MLTSGYFGRQTQRERDAAQQQLAAIDNQLGVGPWGQSMAPLMQENRDNYQLMANDPQAMHRKALEAGVEQERLKQYEAEQERLKQYAENNPFKPSTSVSISAPGRPAGAPSFTQQTQKSKFPNPFS